MSNASKRLIDELQITRVINYLRRSRQDIEHEKKTGEDTLHEQKTLMDRVLTAYEVLYDQRSEIGSGDKISSRPIFQSVIKDLKAKKYDAIAVKEISRMGRGSYTDMGVIYDLIVGKNIFIITPYKVYDPRNPSDLRQIRFELFMSREEFETTRERLSGGRYNAALEGKWVSGPAPFGFGYDPKTKKLVIKENEAEIIRTIFDLYAYGIIDRGKKRLVGLHALATYLNRMGIKSKKGSNFVYTTLKELLSSERYIGRLKYQTTRTTNTGKKEPREENEHVYVDNACPAIIDNETWYIVQQRLNDANKLNPVRLDFGARELAGVCKCAKCNRALIRRSPTQQYRKKDGTISLYKQEFLTCTTVGCTYVKYRQVEDELKNTLLVLINLDDQTLHKTIKNIIGQQKGTVDTESTKKQIKSAKEELKRRMSFVYEKFEKGIYSDEVFLERKSEIDKKMNELNKIHIIDDKPKADVLDTKVVKKNIKSLLDAYEATQNPEHKNEILHSIFERVTVEVTEKGRGRTPSKISVTPYLKRNIVSEKF
ncbi:recombinase family protein [Bacillus sp. FSL W7-1360]